METIVVPLDGSELAEGQGGGTAFQSLYSARIPTLLVPAPVGPGPRPEA